MAKTATLWFPAQRRCLAIIWWAHQDLNLEPADYESDALTN